MKQMRLSSIILGLVASIIVLSGVSVSYVNAQASNANAAQGMQISPALVELNAARGKTYNLKLNVFNVTASDLAYTSSVVDFNAADETGSPHIILDSKLPVTASIKTWISTIPEFTLKGRKFIDINAQVVIPNDAEPGGHYGVIRFSGVAPEVKDTGVGLSASAGVLILIRVDGVITEKAELASFYTELNSKQSSFFENGPISFVTRIRNIGNIHVKPSGSIEVRDMFGNLTKTININKTDPKSNVLPNSIRRFESNFNKEWMFGMYTANLTLGYGITGQAITSTVSFWVIPYKIILAVLLVLVTVIFILKRLLKVYNRRIIEKAKNENKKTKNNSSGKG